MSSTLRKPSLRLLEFGLLDYVELDPPMEDVDLTSVTLDVPELLHALFTVGVESVSHGNINHTKLDSGEKETLVSLLPKLKSRNT